MTNDRPKVLVVGDLGGGAAEVTAALSARFDIDRAQAGRVDRAVLADCDAVVTSPVDLGTLGLAATGQMTDGQAVAVLSAIGEGVCLSTLDGQILWMNERFKGFDDQVKARISAVCRQAATGFADRVLDQEAQSYAMTSKYDVATPDEKRFYEVVVSPVKSEMGEPGRVAAVVWDVTASRRVQQKMDAIDRAGAELVRLDAEAVRKKHVVERLKLLEDKIVRYSHELMRFDHLAIRVIDERTGRLELVIAKGLSPEAMEVELYAQKEGNGIMGYVAATGRSYLCADVRRDRRYVTGMPGAKSSLTVPLRLHDKIIGAFNIESDQVASFTEEDRQFAEIFATHIALALHILDLLVAERCTTGETVTGTVQGEISEPLNDIVAEAQWLRQAAERDPTIKEHVERILSDVGSIRDKIKEAAGGPQTILGADKMLNDVSIDPLLQGRRVLVADDEPKIRETIRNVLRGKGCQVIVCKDGGTAIAELDAARVGESTLGGTFDLVLSDIKMPDHNGYEVFAAARRLSAGLPVILMTGFGYDPHHSIVRASQEGLSCVLFKPFQIERLMDEIYKALGIPGAGGGDATAGGAGGGSAKA